MVIDSHHHYPQQLKTDLLNLDLNAIETIFNNKRKGSWVVKVQIKNRKLAILKWCHPNSSIEQKSQFQKEQAYYTGNCKEKYLPRLYSTTENCLLIEYIESISLRQYLLKITDEKITDVCEVLDCILDKVQYLNIKYDSCALDLTDTANRLTSAWKKLFLSTPMGTRRTKVEQYIARKLSPYFGLVVNRLFLRYLEQTYNKQSKNNCSTIHGDLHNNNILVTADNNVLFIDFENVQVKQFWMLDLLYFLPMFFKLLQTKKQKEACQNILLKLEIFSSKEEQKLFYKCLNTMKFAIFFNRCFGKRAL